MPLLIGILIISTPIFLGLRLSFVFPLAVLEGGLRIFRAWRLACRNSWRLPFVIILGWGACLAPIVAALIALSPTGLPESGNTREALLYFEEELGNLLIVTIADWLGSVIITAVGAGLLCYAFKAVVDSRNNIIEGDGVPAAE